MRNALKSGLVLCIIGVTGAACATKGFVRESVRDVSDKVETLGQSAKVAAVEVAT
jgi:hypothetical protein